MSSFEGRQVLEIYFVDEHFEGLFFGSPKDQKFVDVIVHFELMQDWPCTFIVKMATKNKGKSIYCEHNQLDKY